MHVVNSCILIVVVQDILQIFIELEVFPFHASINIFAYKTLLKLLLFMFTTTSYIVLFKISCVNGNAQKITAKIMKKKELVK